MRQTDEDDKQDDRAADDRRIAEQGAAHRPQDCAEREEKDQRAVDEELFLGRCVTMTDEFCHRGTDLSDMIGDEGGRRRDALDLTEGVELHRADEVQRHLTDLVGSVFRQQSQHDHDDDLEADQKRVPPEKMEALDGLAEVFRYERAEEVGADGDQQICRMFPPLLSERHGEQHDVRRLGVAEYASAQDERVCPEPSRRGDQQPVDPPLFTFQIFVFDSLLVQVKDPFALFVLIIPDFLPVCKNPPA